jgi:hypothetical protein
MIARRLHDCRSKKLAAAKTDHEVRLTFKGMRLAERTARALGLKVPVWKSKLVGKSKVDKLQVTGTAKPAPTAKPVGKLRVDKLQVTKTVKPTLKKKPSVRFGIQKPKRVDEVKVVEKLESAPKVKGSVAKPKPAKVKPAPKVKIPVVETPKVKVSKRSIVHRPSSVVEVPKQEVKGAKPVSKPKIKRKKRVDEVKVVGKLKVDKLQVAEAVQVAPVAKPKIKPAQKAKVPAPVTKPKPTPAKPKVKVPIVKAPKVEAEQKPLFHVPTVSAEEKARASKFVKMMEASDAYRLYKKNGANSNIGEFDFRSLLLCTMESSPETLARNVELFKGYAGIHNRQDLITFLTFCREKFAHLLLPEKKAVRKLR